ADNWSVSTTTPIAWPGCVMEFYVECSCGRQVVVSESAAGLDADCPCGRTVPIPSLGELRARAGVPRYPVAPELVIEECVATGAFPIGTACAHCSVDTTEMAVVVIECERSFVKQPSRLWWVIAGLFAPLAMLGSWRAREQEEGPHGRDKIYPLRLPL